MRRRKTKTLVILIWWALGLLTVLAFYWFFISRYHFVLIPKD